eukprot:COSAG02_NODE_53354_length_302_cov_0.945813_1_plen_75_part_01
MSPTAATAATAVPAAAVSSGPGAARLVLRLATSKLHTADKYACHRTTGTDMVDVREGLHQSTTIGVSVLVKYAID